MGFGCMMERGDMLVTRRGDMLVTRRRDMLVTRRRKARHRLADHYYSVNVSGRNKAQQQDAKD
jgi:hypothetical protein